MPSHHDITSDAVSLYVVWRIPSSAFGTFSPRGGEKDSRDDQNAWPLENETSNPRFPRGSRGSA